MAARLGEKPAAELNPQGCQIMNSNKKTTRSLSPNKLANAIDREHLAATTAAEAALEHGRKCGELLTQAKSELGHGEFQRWLSDNCSVGTRQAQRYMRVANRWDEISNATSKTHLTLSEAIELITEPKAPVVFPLPRYGYWMHGVTEEAGHVVIAPSPHDGYFRVAFVGDDGAAEFTARGVIGDFVEKFVTSETKGAAIDWSDREDEGEGAEFLEALFAPVEEDGIESGVTSDLEECF